MRIKDGCPDKTSASTMEPTVKIIKKGKSLVQSPIFLNWDKITPSNIIVASIGYPQCRCELVFVVPETSSKPGVPPVRYVIKPDTITKLSAKSQELHDFFETYKPKEEEEKQAPPELRRQKAVVKAEQEVQKAVDAAEVSAEKDEPLGSKPGSSKVIAPDRHPFIQIYNVTDCDTLACYVPTPEEMEDISRAVGCTKQPITVEMDVPTLFDSLRMQFNGVNSGSPGSDVFLDFRKQIVADRKQRKPTQTPSSVSK
jgi:hypothetical protein